MRFRRTGRPSSSPFRKRSAQCRRRQARRGIPRPMHDFPLALLAATVSSYWIGVGVMIARVRRADPHGRRARPGAAAGTPHVARLGAAGRRLDLRAVGHARRVRQRSRRSPISRCDEPALRRAALDRGDRRRARSRRDGQVLAADGQGLADGRQPRPEDRPHHRRAVRARPASDLRAFILLMLCSAAIVPTAPMLVVAALHVVLLNIKARNEERHLAGVHGDAYAQYLRRTGRFLPRRPARDEGSFGALNAAQRQFGMRLLFRASGVGIALRHCLRCGRCVWPPAAGRAKPPPRSGAATSIRPSLARLRRARPGAHQRAARSPRSWRAFPRRGSSCSRAASPPSPWSRSREFLIAMGYPPDRIGHPRDGSHSASSFADSRQVAGTLAWYYETEGVRPLLIGHSQGGMLAIRVLHDLAGAFGDAIPVWNPVTRRRGAAHGDRRSAERRLAARRRAAPALRRRDRHGQAAAPPARAMGDAGEAPRDPGQRRGIHRVRHRMGPHRGAVPALRPVSGHGVGGGAQRDPSGDVHAHRVAGDRSSRGRPGHAGLDRGVRARRQRGNPGRGRGRHDEPRSRRRHLAQREAALGHRGKAARRRAAPERR